MPINPNSAFVRVVVDVPTPVALRLEEYLKTVGKSRTRYIAELLASDVEAKTQPAKAKARGK